MEKGKEEARSPTLRVLQIHNRKIQKYKIKKIQKYRNTNTGKGGRGSSLTHCQRVAPRASSPSPSPYMHSGYEEDEEEEAGSLTASVLLHEPSQHAEQMLKRQKFAG